MFSFFRFWIIGRFNPMTKELREINEFQEDDTGICEVGEVFLKGEEGEEEVGDETPEDLLKRKAAIKNKTAKQKENKKKKS